MATAIKFTRSESVAVDGAKEYEVYEVGNGYTPLMLGILYKDKGDSDWRNDLDGVEFEGMTFATLNEGKRYIREEMAKKWLPEPEPRKRKTAPTGAKDKSAKDESGYQGWTNRETWALMLNISNDEGLKSYIRQVAEDAKKSARDTILNLTDDLESILESWRAEVKDGHATPEMRLLVLEVGSDWRVNFRECAEHIIEWID